jgi:NADH:ubiquinone oxidoreductase subunit K
MPPSVATVALWLSVLFGVNIALVSVALGLWFPTGAATPDGRYLPFLVSAVAVEGAIGVALLLLIVRRRLARVGAMVLPPVAVSAATVAGTTVPLGHDIAGPMFGGLVAIALLIVLYLFATADAKAWFRVPPGRWW